MTWNDIGTILGITLMYASPQCMDPWGLFEMPVWSMSGSKAMTIGAFTGAAAAAANNAGSVFGSRFIGSDIAIWPLRRLRGIVVSGAINFIGELYLFLLTSV